MSIIFLIFVITVESPFYIKNIPNEYNNTFIKNATIFTDQIKFQNSGLVIKENETVFYIGNHNSSLNNFTNYFDINSSKNIQNDIAINFTLNISNNLSHNETLLSNRTIFGSLNFINFTKGFTSKLMILPAISNMVYAIGFM